MRNDDHDYDGYDDENENDSNNFHSRPIPNFKIHYFIKPS